MTLTEGATLLMRICGIEGAVKKIREAQQELNTPFQVWTIDTEKYLLTCLDGEGNELVSTRYFEYSRRGVYTLHLRNETLMLPKEFEYENL